jgi:NAD(P) transhydrogenase subunit alpha
MRICSTFENKQSEKRITITPEIAKKYINLGLEVSLIENYGLHLGYDDSQYKESGVKIIKDEKELINNADIIVQLGLLADDKISILSLLL